MDTEAILKQELERKTREELIVLAKSLGIRNGRARKKSELVDAILESGEEQLARALHPTWWRRYHGHVYGLASVVGLVLTVLFFVWPSRDDLGGNTAPQVIGRSGSTAGSKETPIPFADFAALPSADRTALLNRYRGKEVIWEGYFSESIGFEAGGWRGAPIDTPVGLRMTPGEGNPSHVTAECQIGVLGPTDGGVFQAMSLSVLSIGQRVRVWGELQGDCDRPILTNAVLYDSWPLDE